MGFLNALGPFAFMIPIAIILGSIVWFAAFHESKQDSEPSFALRILARIWCLISNDPYPYTQRKKSTPHIPASPLTSNYTSDEPTYSTFEIGHTQPATSTAIAYSMSTDSLISLVTDMNNFVTCDPDAFPEVMMLPDAFLEARRSKATELNGDVLRFEALYKAYDSSNSSQSLRELMEYFNKMVQKYQSRTALDEARKIERYL